MSAPTRIEREHYQKLIGRQILAIYWDELEGKALPILVLSGRDLDGHAATAALAAYPYSVVASPHLFERDAVPNLCTN